jgi:AcrR family transcriptional regulator
MIKLKKSLIKKEKLINAACDVFIEKGYHDATVAEICARAGANVSAVNYHFGSKETLYQEAWRHSFKESLKAYPLNGNVSDTASTEERLRGHVTSMIQRVADENNKDIFILLTEMTHPTGLLQDVMITELHPMREKTLGLVRELLGPDATENQAFLCEISIFSMCFHPMVMQRIAKRTKNNEIPNIIDDIENARIFADHVVLFSLAGVQAVRNVGCRS